MLRRATRWRVVNGGQGTKLFFPLCHSHPLLSRHQKEMCHASFHRSRTQFFIRIGHSTTDVVLSSTDPCNVSNSFSSLFLRPITFSCFPLYSGGIVNANAIFLSRCKESHDPDVASRIHLRLHCPWPFIILRRQQPTTVRVSSSPSSRGGISFCGVEKLCLSCGPNTRR